MELSTMDTIKNTEERYSAMSLCIALIYRNSLYLAADSINSLVLQRSEFTGRPIITSPLSFSEEKIFKLPFANRTVFAITTGINRINGQSVKHFVCNLQFQEDETLVGIANYLKTEITDLLPQSGTFELRLFEYMDSELKTIKFYFIKNEVTITEEAFPLYQQPHLTRILMGTEWGKLLADYIPVSAEELSTDDTVAYINAVYSRIQAASVYFDASIGGPIKIVKITPGSYHWIQ